MYAAAGMHPDSNRRGPFDKVGTAPHTPYLRCVLLGYPKPAQLIGSWKNGGIGRICRSRCRRVLTFPLRYGWRALKRVFSLDVHFVTSCTSH